MNHPDTDLLDGKWLEVGVKPEQFSQEISCWASVEPHRLLLVPKDVKWTPSLGESIEVSGEVFKIDEIVENCQHPIQKSFPHYDCVMRKS